ncbi:Protein of unknown function [Singulisphaera sp. GP187]|uniref:DUF3124 domain-containing protein n=1 Tax=Singulisphaera sp. GP187 TaxID=1882752 RepID=UPI00092696CE|nr:DUF3124 domain-containing protein [Singulisphaera sp. GP187]SIO58237.1 Protein of unknown function [Singulisphaera sp. GP187]
MRRTNAAAILLAGLLGSGTSCGLGGAPGAGSNGLASPLGGAPRLGVTEVAIGPDFQAVAGQTVYVPVYSHVFTSDDARPFRLAVTLSVRNTDQVQPIILVSVKYHDRDGRLVRDTLKKPLRIAPLASMDFFVEENDTTGGSSASYLLEWVAERSVSAPVAEAVMIGTASTQGISFVCPGRVVAER